MVEDALKVSFDSSIGLDYNESEDERLAYYKSRETFTSIGIPSLDKALGGGVRPSSLFMVAAPSHGGKSAFKVFLSCNLLLNKENVLFITLEMPELEIAKRIDANLMGVTINELSELPNDVLHEKWKAAQENIGKLVIKEYGAGTFNALHLKSLLDELKSKKDFVPDAICIDYLGLMVSHRASHQSNSYDMLGKVAEDLHAIAKETYDSKGNKGIKMITSSQLNRGAYGNMDAGMESVSESMKIMMTADVALMLLTSD
jgi:replicative DNA helicase